jgi:phasin family protein
MLQCKIIIDFFVQCNIFALLRLSSQRRGSETRIGRTPEEVNEMVKNIDEFQQIGKDNMDATMKSFGALSKGAQAIAVEVADYTRKVFEQGTATTEKLIGAKSLDKAFEVQSDYVKNSYEGFVAQATKLGELYADLAKEAYKPFESQFGKVAAATK